jgi:hypothetical protein
MRSKFVFLSVEFVCLAGDLMRSRAECRSVPDECEATETTSIKEEEGEEEEEEEEGRSKSRLDDRTNNGQTKRTVAVELTHLESIDVLECDGRHNKMADQ